MKPLVVLDTVMNENALLNTKKKTINKNILCCSVNGYEAI